MDISVLGLCFSTFVYSVNYFRVILGYVQTDTGLSTTLSQKTRYQTVVHICASWPFLYLFLLHWYIL